MTNTPPNLIAWCPVKVRQKVFLAAILCPPEQPMDRDWYMTYLGMRIQRLVSSSPDPREVTRSLQEELYRTGLVPEMGFCLDDEAGQRLVTYNPSVEEKVGNLGVFKALKSFPKAPAVDNLAVRRVLQVDPSDPDGSLLLWAQEMGHRMSCSSFSARLESSQIDRVIICQLVAYLAALAAYMPTIVLAGGLRTQCHGNLRRGFRGASTDEEGASACIRPWTVVTRKLLFSPLQWGPNEAFRGRQFR